MIYIVLLFVIFAFVALVLLASIASGIHRIARALERPEPAAVEALITAFWDQFNIAVPQFMRMMGMTR